MEQLGSFWIGFCEILHWAVLFKSGMKPSSVKVRLQQQQTSRQLREDVSMFGLH
jgi:hypothetical protein